MKVICINDDFSYESVAIPEIQYVKQLPQEGEIYEVEERTCDLNYKGYVIKNIDCGTLPNGKPVAFRLDRFMALHQAEDLVEIEINQNNNQKQKWQ